MTVAANTSRQSGSQIVSPFQIEKERLLQELARLEQTYKSGILSKSEYTSVKSLLEKKLRVVEQREKQTIAKEKAVVEILGTSILPSHNQQQPSKKFEKPQKKHLPKKELKEIIEQHPDDYHSIDELLQKEESTNWRFAFAVLTIFLLILLYIKFTSFLDTPDLVTVDAYLDYNSLYSHDMHNVLQSLLLEYGNTVLVEYYLIGSADSHLLSGVAVSCANLQDRKQEYFDYLFSQNSVLATAEEFVAVAEILGLAKEDFAGCLSSADMHTYLQQQREFQELGILYTPTLVINNKKIVGAVGYDAVKKVIDEEMLQLG